MRIPCKSCDGCGSARKRDEFHPFCNDCDGSGNQICANRDCEDDANGFDEDGNAMCDACLHAGSWWKFEPRSKCA
jgi:hypothetical protein